MHASPDLGRWKGSYRERGRAWSRVRIVLAKLRTASRGRPSRRRWRHADSRRRPCRPSRRPGDRWRVLRSRVVFSGTWTLCLTLRRSVRGDERRIVIQHRSYLGGHRRLLMQLLHFAVQRERIRFVEWRCLRQVVLAGINRRDRRQTCVRGANRTSAPWCLAVQAVFGAVYRARAAYQCRHPIAQHPPNSLLFTSPRFRQFPVSRMSRIRIQIYISLYNLYAT